MKLPTKTLIATVTLFAVIAGMSGFFSAHTLYHSLTAEYRSKGIAIAESVADSSAEILLNRDLATVQATIDQFAEIAGVAYVFVTNSDGEIVAHTFVPAVPAEIRPQIEESLHEARTGGAIAHTVRIKGLGDIIHIHEPILAGVAGYVHVGMDLGFIRKQIRRAIIEQQALIFAVFAIVVALAWVIVRRVSRPLEVLADYTQSLAEEDFSAGLAVPEEIEALPRKSHDEVGRLASAFLEMKKTLMVYLEDLKRTTAAKERFESELNIAHDIQMSLVPKNFPPYPDRREFDLFATLVPAREVGGDFYDFYFIDARRLCFAIGDVSDKGVPASLFMAATTTLFRALGRDPDATAQSIVTRLNQEISRENDSCMFVTAFCGVLDTHTGEVEYCNAGHNPPLIISANGVSVLPASNQAAIGMTEDAEYRSSQFSLASGDSLLLYTDGITEAMDGAQQQFTLERLQQLQGLAQLDCTALAARVMKEVEQFCGDAPQSDDRTMLVLAYHGGSGTRRRVLSERLRRDPEELARIIAAWNEQEKAQGFDQHTAFRVRLGLEELLTNIINHGGGSGDIEVSVDTDGTDVVVEIRDGGPPFNPLEIPAPDTSQSLEDREPGGLGIHLLRKMFDRFTYRRENGANVVILNAATASRSNP